MHGKSKSITTSSPKPPAKKVKRLSHKLNWRERHPNNKPIPSLYNARLAVEAMGIECSYDTFHNKMLVGYRGDKSQHTVERVLGDVSDNSMLALRQILSDQFNFDPT